MKKQWIMSTVALLSLAGMIGVGCAAQEDEATADTPVASEALATTTDTGTATEALTQQCHIDGCRRLHAACKCENTGWHGYCGTGPHHPGCMYCRCD